MRLRGVPFTDQNSPPTRIFPSGWSASVTAMSFKAGIQAAVGIEPGHAVAAGIPHLGEEPADQQFPVGLYSNGINIAIKTRLERGIHAARLGFGTGAKKYS